MNNTAVQPQDGPRVASPLISSLREDFQTKTREIKADRAAKAEKEIKGRTVTDVLSELINTFEEIDFRERAKLEPDQKITQKIYVVQSADIILEKAKAQNWGIGVNNDFIYIYNGKYWQPTGTGDFKTFLSDAAKKMGVPLNDAKYYKFQDELYKQFISIANLTTPDPNNNITLINLQNGTFEISKDKQSLRDYRREDFLKYQLTFSYDPSAEAPMFEKYLERVLPDEDCRKVLAEYIGYIFTHGFKLEKIALLYGSGANGKSVFFDIITALLGRENTCSFSLQSLTKTDSYQRGELSDKLLNYASEINGSLEASIFKQLASGEPVGARRIYGRPFTMEKYAKLMFNCNELPKETEQTHAFFRRFLIIPFTQTIPEAERDVNLSKKIIGSELSGVFNWVLDGLKRLLAQGAFTASPVIENQLKEFRMQSDSVSMFLEECSYKQSSDNKILLQTLYNEYRNFCLVNGYYSVSNKTLKTRLETLGYETRKTMAGQCVFIEKSDEHFNTF